MTKQVVTIDTNLPIVLPRTITKRKRRENEREEEKTKRKAKHWRSRLLDHDSSVEVGYGLCYFIVNS